MERSASVFKYYGNKFINDKMKKAKIKEEKLKKTRKINRLSQKEIIDNNISILFSTFNILKSNKMEEKKILTLILKIKTKIVKNTRTLCFQFALTIPNLKMKKKKRKMRKKITSSIII